MELTLLLLKNPQVTLVSLTEQLPEEPRVHLKNPYLVSGKTKLSLQRWPDHTDDEHVLLSSDNLLTVCEPSPKVRALYLEKVGLTEEDLKPIYTNTVESFHFKYMFKDTYDNYFNRFYPNYYFEDYFHRDDNHFKQ